MSSISESAVESRISKGTKVSGKLFFKGPARIEGETDGEITADDLTIANGAVVTGRITAARITVAGTLSGELVARERVEFRETARVRCSVQTPVLALAEGAQFDGDCKMPRDRAAA